MKLFSLLIALGLASVTLQAQRLVLPAPQQGNMSHLQLQRLSVHADIAEESAVVSLEQDFFNPSANQLEGYYLFPIPQGSTISRFTMMVNGKETPAELLDAGKARQIYENIVRQSLDPALLEYYDFGLLKMRVFPIQPRQTQHIKLVYNCILPKDAGLVEFHYPLRSASAAQPMQSFVFSANIETKGKLKSVFCPTHSSDIRIQDEHHAKLSFEAENFSASQDLKLYFHTESGQIGATALSYHDGRSEGFFLLNISPGFGSGQAVVEKDITFVLDASGSMAGKKMAQAKKALSYCVERLAEGDRFNIVRFSTEASSLNPALEKASKANKADAQRYIDQLEPVGGTNISEALGMALDMRKSDEARPYFIIFITDGKPTIGEIRPDALIQQVAGKNSSQTRIFTFGVGEELNTILLDKLSDMTKATRSYVGPDEDIEVKVSAFYDKVASPVMSDISLEWERGISQIYPTSHSDLFKGGTLSVMGRYREGGTTRVTLVGKVNGKEERHSFTVDLVENDEAKSFVPPLWAARAIGHMLNQIRLHGETEELKQEIVQLAKRYGIVTPYTSYLIIEDERQQLGNNGPVPGGQLLSPRVAFPEEAVVMDEIEMDYKANQSASDKASIRASSEVQTLSTVTSMGESDQGKDRLNYRDAQGREQNLADGIVQVQGRAFYNNNGQWLDANLQQSLANAKPNRIAFNSKAYFDLLKQHPESQAYLALGRNVRFEMGGAVWEIYEE